MKTIFLFIATFCFSYTLLAQTPKEARELNLKTKTTWVTAKKGKKQMSYKKAFMRKYKCVVCGYIYDPVEGDPDSGISPGTAFEDIPDDWQCPVCGIGKSDFELLDE